MRNITAMVTITDNCPGAAFVLESITSNEPDNGLGDGDFPDDIQEADFNTDDLSFMLRSERSGLGNDRVYTVTYTVTDASDNSASASATVTVPHSLRPKLALQDDALPNQFSLEQNYPNPFNPRTMIRFNIPVEAMVTLRVFDALGREVATLMNGEFRDAGRYEMPFDGLRLGSGIYTYQLSAISSAPYQQFFDTKKMILMK
jgi:hypothetical protein